MHVCGRNLITGLTSAASPRVNISRTCKVEQKLGVSLPLFTCSLSAWPSRLLYHRGRKSRRDLSITLYLNLHVYGASLWFSQSLNLELFLCPVLTSLSHDQQKTLGTVLMMCWKYLEIIQWNNVTARSWTIPSLLWRRFLRKKKKLNILVE